MHRRELFKGLIFGLAALQTTKSFGQDIMAIGEKDKDLEKDQALDPATADRMQYKIKHFDEDFPDDIYVSEAEAKVLARVVKKLTLAKKLVGYGHFNLIGFDDILKILTFSELGPFTKVELDFIESTYCRDARDYGFFGDKVLSEITAKIDTSKAIKIAGTGHFLYRGRPEKLYAELKADIGSDIVLTSGIRSVVKQLDLFYNKAVQCHGNLSRASRSLAPPGYSFHGIGDFDVGKIGFGADNFTDNFATTDVYKRLTDLGYVDIRYTETNSYGVRFEPWHIKV